MGNGARWGGVWGGSEAPLTPNIKKNVIIRNMDEATNILIMANNIMPANNVINVCQ